MVKAAKFLQVCKECKAKCCKMGGPDFSEKEMRKVLKVGYKNYFIKVGKNHYELKSKRGVCPYLKKDFSCEIHEVKPLMCLCWPVVVDIKKGKRKYFLVECPMTSLLTKKDIEKCKNEASKIPKDVLTKDTKLSKFDQNLIRKRFSKFKKKNLK